MLEVLVHNDDVTPMEFVAMVLESVFEKSRDEALKVMLHAHHDGRAICGVYTDARPGPRKSGDGARRAGRIPVAILLRQRAMSRHAVAMDFAGLSSAGPGGQASGRSDDGRLRPEPSALRILRAGSFSLPNTSTPS
jgi:hypothetical protein